MDTNDSCYKMWLGAGLWVFILSFSKKQIKMTLLPFHWLLLALTPFLHKFLECTPSLRHWCTTPGGSQRELLVSTVNSQKTGQNTLNKWFQTLENRQHRTITWNRKEAKQSESYDCLGFLPGGVYQTSGQGGRTQAEHRGLTELMG